MATCDVRAKLATPVIFFKRVSTVILKVRLLEFGVFLLNVPAAAANRDYIWTAKTLVWLEKYDSFLPYISPCLHVLDQGHIYGQIRENNMNEWTNVLENKSFS